jgi:uncharacterized protein YqgV (UPF0045/DUF77 family)
MTIQEVARTLDEIADKIKSAEANDLTDYLSATITSLKPALSEIAEAVSEAEDTLLRLKQKIVPRVVTVRITSTALAALGKVIETT